MSRQTASGAPASAAARAAPTAPPAGPESTVHDPWRAASAAGATPPPDSITSGTGSPASTARVGEPLEVGAQQGGEACVDDGRRAALVLAEHAGRLVRERDVHVVPEHLAARELVTGVAEAPEQADGGGVELSGRVDPAAQLVARRAGASTPSGSGPLRRRDAQLRRNDRRRVPGAEPVQLAASLPAELLDVGEPLGRDQRGARDLALEQRVRADGHPVHEPLDVVRARAGCGRARPRRQRGRRSTGRPAWSAPSPCADARPRRARRP